MTDRITTDPAAPRRLRIGIDASRAFVRQPSGTEHYATALIRSLCAIDGHDYRLYFRDAPYHAPPPGPELRVLPAPRLWTHGRLLAELLRHPPDLLFVPAHVLPVVTRVPSVVTVHDLGYEAFPDAHAPRQLAYLRWSTRRHARLATRLIADSQCTKRDLVERYGADPGRVDVVMLAADEDMRPPSPEAAAAIRARLGIAAGQDYFLHVGTNRPRKNLPRLVEAFALASAVDPDLRLVLAGMPGRADEALDASIRAFDLQERVLLPGYLPRGELPALYGAALALVFPSLYEGFGLPVLEAMACGAPVICSQGSSLPEVGGAAARYFDPTDPSDIAAGMRRIRDDAPLRDAMREAGRRHAASFSWRRCALETQATLVRAYEEARVGAAGVMDRSA